MFLKKMLLGKAEQNTPHYGIEGDGFVSFSKNTE